MPELPEMENYRRQLAGKINGKMITDVQVGREKSINMNPDLFASEVSGSKVTNVVRRAKHLLFDLDSGKRLLLHLMLGGWMYIGDAKNQPDHKAQIILSFGSEHLYFHGLRLGYLHLLTAKETEDKLKDLGPEPLHHDFKEEDFIDIIKNKRSALKTLLVDQQVVAGIGNRYSDEICYQAELMPLRKVNELQESEKIKLFQAISSVLSEAVRLGGYMDRPLYKGDQQTGGFLSHFNVYNQEGEPCGRCGAEIVKNKISSRKTFYCPNCQY